MLIANTDIGETWSTSDDGDKDGFEADFDNCPFIQNRDQTDSDGDGVGDACDNAANVSNSDQSDIDGDGVGDVSDDDVDGDTKPNGLDNCPRVYNPTQQRTMTAASQGDACNSDDDLDGTPDIEDACPKVPGSVAQNGRACDDDEDLDGYPDASDNCPGVANDKQLDTNKNGLGDACDPDIDGDRILNNLDNAPTVSNPDQKDADQDGIGDVADQEFCFVFDPNAKNACLNPLDTFKIGAITLNPDRKEDLTGDSIRLVMFANRQRGPIEYTWTVESSPKGSKATVKNAVGQLQGAEPGTYQYAQPADGAAAPTFVPDEPGAYQLKVVARLVNGDDVFAGGPAVASYSVGLKASGESQATGCSAVGRDTGLTTLVLVALGLIVLRSKRRAIR